MEKFYCGKCFEKQDQVGKNTRVLSQEDLPAKPSVGTNKISRPKSLSKSSKEIPLSKSSEVITSKERERHSTSTPRENNPSNPFHSLLTSRDKYSHEAEDTLRYSRSEQEIKKIQFDTESKDKKSPRKRVLEKKTQQKRE